MPSQDELDRKSRSDQSIDSLIEGIEIGDDPTEVDPTSPIKIDGLASEAFGKDSWHIRCHVCDSVLSVTDQMVGSTIKCNDCYSLLKVKPSTGKAGTQRSGVADETPSTDSASENSLGFADETDNGSDRGVFEGGELTLEPLRIKPVDPVSGSPESGVDREGNSESTAGDELTLAPPVELAPDLLEAQKASLLVGDDALVELDEAPIEPVAEEDLDDLMELEPLELENTSFELEQPVTASGPKASGQPDGDSEAEDDDDDSDEMIELLDIPPEEANSIQSAGLDEPVARPAVTGAAVSEGDAEGPVRVHARRRNRKTEPTKSEKENRKDTFSSIEDTSLSTILDRSFGVLKTGGIWIWATIAVLLMWAGTAVWHGAGPESAPEDVTLWQNILNYGVGITVGLIPFWSGYIVLMFVGGVVFRETAKGNHRIAKMTPSDAADFTSTMLLFGFSMFIAALPFLFLYTFIWVPLQLFLSGVFLFCAWQNQSAFAIVSGSLFTSFRRHSASWKKWVTVTAVAACGGFVAGLLLEINWSVLSVFTSLVGALILTFSTLVYAAATGWHAGSFTNGDGSNV